MSKTRFIKVAAIITIIAAGLGTGAFFLQRSYQYNYADIRSVAVNGDAKQLEAVIKHGADVNATDEDGRPVLFWAMRKPGNKDNILILINNGADVNFLYNQVSPLTMALTNLTDKEVFEALLAHGSDVNYYGVDGNTPLMLASAYQSDPEVVKLLLAHGAKIDAINDEGQTALMFAVVSTPNPQVLKALLDGGASVNLEDERGNTAFILASLKLKDSRFLDLLTLYGADIYHKNRDGKDALALVKEVSQQIENAKDAAAGN